MNSRCPHLNDWIIRQWQAAGGCGDDDFALLLTQSNVDSDQLATRYESHLQTFDIVTRKARGVYYTPPEVVRFIVRAVDDYLREEFGWPLGLLDERARILDPALGAGVFLTETICFVHGAFAQRMPGEDWNKYVAINLLPRLGGIEILSDAAQVAVVRIALALAATGYRMADDAVLQLRIGDALAEPIRPAWNVIVGNPPFSGISNAKHAWLQNLLHGKGPEGEPRASYFAIAGKLLRERKHWLQDDYVKFMRISQEQIETIGSGLVALVTNHGYLDNVTFRGLRAALAETFNHISVIDLHGNAKRRERTPANERDENVFAIEQGVAIGLWRRVPVERNRTLGRADIWGTRGAKLTMLDQISPRDLTFSPIDLHLPGGAWLAGENTKQPQYDAGWSLADIFPLNSTAPVTARDSFVVAFSHEELLERCRDMLDQSLSDEELRSRYFRSTRSRLYPAGDTRGWKLPAARQRMRDQSDIESLIIEVQYRPLDVRFMLWANWLIDWPRSEVMQHIVGRENFTLIARRQAPPGRVYNDVWISDRPTLDGVIRSDNCGSESLFPLWTYIDNDRQANLSPQFLEQLAAKLICERGELSPERILGYLYALLSSPYYCQRYAARLRQDFPRMIWPSSRAQFQQLSALGLRLFDVQSQRVPQISQAWQQTDDTRITTGMPRWIDGTVHINASCHLPHVPAEVWNFTIGSHQPLRKYLKDRRGRVLSTAELARYASMVGVFAATLSIQSEIDAVLRNSETSSP